MCYYRLIFLAEADVKVASVFVANSAHILWAPSLHRASLQGQHLRSQNFHIHQMFSSMQPGALLPVLLGIHNLPVNPDAQVGVFAGWAVAMDGEEGVVVAGH